MHLVTYIHVHVCITRCTLSSSHTVTESVLRNYFFGDASNVPILELSLVCCKALLFLKTTFTISLTTICISRFAHCPLCSFLLQFYLFLSFLAIRQFPLSLPYFFHAQTFCINFSANLPVFKCPFIGIINVSFPLHAPKIYMLSPSCHTLFRTIE